MKPRVYVETSVVSYLTAQPSRDIVVAGRQQTTRDWWASAPQRFELVVSEVIEEEAAVGDDDAARARLAALGSLTRLAAPTEAGELAHRLVDAGALPARAAQDALHIAIASVRQIPFLVTWNFRHLASAAARRQIEAVCRAGGIDAPVLCTPEQLVTEDAEMKSDPIVAEVRAVRERLAARFDYDIDAIVRHAQKLEAEATREGALPLQRESAALDAEGACGERGHATGRSVRGGSGRAAGE